MAKTGETRNVRVDSAVTGAERVRLPAGEFDTLTITRVIYAGDANSSGGETRTQEIEWYAPALRRAVRWQTQSAHTDYRQGSAVDLVRGDRILYELVELRAGSR